MRKLLLIELLLIVALFACSKKAPEDKRPKGKLCFAPNTAEMFAWTKDGQPVDYSEGKPLTIKYRGKVIALPNEQQGFADAREGEPVAVLRDDKLVESWKVGWKLGADLCYYFRSFDPAWPDRNPKWILDAAAADDRCTCW
jgi:hypothetical protein